MMTEQIFQVGLYLGLIVGLIMLLGYGARRFAPQNTISAAGGMKVVSSLSLGMKEKLVLVQIGEQQVLLGVTQSNISRIESFEQNVIEPNTEGFSDFRFKLQEMMQGQAEKK